jgi:hypothetical protein
MGWSDRLCARQARSDLALVDLSFCFVRGVSIEPSRAEEPVFASTPKCSETPPEQHSAASGFLCGLRKPEVPLQYNYVAPLGPVPLIRRWNGTSAFALNGGST